MGPVLPAGEVLAQPVDLRRAWVLDVTPHQPIEVCVTDTRRAAHHGPIRGREPLDDLLGVHIAQYTYLSDDCKPHMYTGLVQNAWMVEKQARQTLARNVADRMHRDPNLDTQEKLAARAKVAQPHISRILRGRSAATIDVLAGLARAFGCQPWELLVDTELTRQAALQRMIVGSPAPDSRVAAALGPPPKRKARA